MSAMNEQTTASEASEQPCTVCGHALSEHAFDRSSGHDHFMYCPTAERLPDPSESAVPVNEFGMAQWDKDPDRVISPG